jgi:hypothetical protein
LGALRFRSARRATPTYGSSSTVEQIRVEPPSPALQTIVKVRELKLPS